MSVYSGFATRQQENKYNFLIETLVITLKKRLMKFYRDEPCDEHKFKLLVKKLYKKMFLLEKGKYMTPKYSTCFTDLVESLQITINYDSLSDASSMLSQTFSLRKDPLKPGSASGQDIEEQFKSRTILQSKRNILEDHMAHNHALNNTVNMNMSAFSLKKPYFNTLNVENQEEASKELNPLVGQRSNSLGINQKLLGMSALKNKVKLRKIEDLKSLRGTMHMPKVDDYMPKKEEIQPAFFRKPPIMEGLKEQNPQRGGYRRQKYSRAEVSVQEI